MARAAARRVPPMHNDHTLCSAQTSERAQTRRATAQVRNARLEKARKDEVERVGQASFLKKKGKGAIARKAMKVRNARLEKSRKNDARVAQASSLKKKGKGAIPRKVLRLADGHVGPDKMEAVDALLTLSRSRPHKETKSTASFNTASKADRVPNPTSCRADASPSPPILSTGCSGLDDKMRERQSNRRREQTAFFDPQATSGSDSSTVMRAGKTMKPSSFFAVGQVVSAWHW